MINIIAACDRNRLIGKNGTLPWKIQKDWDYFLKTTKNGVLIMGRKCYEDFQDHVSSYEIIVLSKKGQKCFSQAKCSGSLQEAIQLGLEAKKTLWICGGRKVYEEAMPIADRLYLTQIDQVYEGDVYFPPWEKIFNHPLSSSTDNEKGVGLEFLVLGKK
ncbi:MAG: dihydrofolate reductase [Opitutales bacterium]|nr:dihydrofolate reductase [Opitutales bacterium]